MIVLYWQLFIVATIAAAFFLASKKWAFYLVIGWTLWTLLMIFSSELALLQLVFAWGSYFVFCKWTENVQTLGDKRREIKEKEKELRKKNRKIEALKGVLDHYPNWVKPIAEEAKEENRVSILRDSDHYRFMIESLSEARTSFLVLSGWVHNKVVDIQFMNELRKALQRGVEVYLGFGYKDSKGRHNLLPGSKKALKELANLEKASREMKGTLYVGQFNNHQKVLIQDKKRVVCGSHNWLSNKTFRNKERSLVVEDQEMASGLFEEVSKVIGENLYGS
jgi:phosphatidylserine/phosphatidylglycerophosphate/cardiolipin synthase-like enzyme